MSLNIYKSLLFFLFNYLLAYKEYPYSFMFAYESLVAGTYIRFAKRNNELLYIVTGEDVLKGNNKFNRYINIYHEYSASYVKTISYESDFGFWRGEPYLVGNNSQYLFITTFDDEYRHVNSFEILDINEIKTKQKLDSDIHGYRRGFAYIKPYYYIISLKGDFANGWYISLKKMSFIQENNFPEFKIEKINERGVKIEYQAMISCEKSLDKNIICAYYSENAKVSISAFTENLEHIIDRNYEEVGYKDMDRFIKIIYFKGYTNFILMNSQTQEVTRLRYFCYRGGSIYDKLSRITKREETYLDISYTQFAGFDGDNDILAINQNKIIKLYSEKKIIITIIQFNDNDSIMSIIMVLQK